MSKRERNQQPFALPAIEARLAAATQVHLECQTHGNTVYVVDTEDPDGLAYGSFDDFSLAVEAVRVVRRLLSRNKLFAPADLAALVAEVKQLRKELGVTDCLLDTRNKVLDAIPECPDHGSQCVPHALAWIDKQVAQLTEVLEEAA